LHVDELLKILQCRLCRADEILNSKLEQLVDTLKMFTYSIYQQAAPTYHLQFHSFYIFYTEEFSTVLLCAREHCIKQSFYTTIVLPDDRPIQPATCRS
jgi:hypothetical protein